MMRGAWEGDEERGGGGTARVESARSVGER